MDKQSHAQSSVKGHHWYIPKLQRLHRWILEMDKQFHPTFGNGYNYLPMLELKLKLKFDNMPLLTAAQLAFRQLYVK